MAKFLTTAGTSHHIEDIIIKAVDKIVLVSPFLHLSKIFFERLKDATAKGVEIIIIYGKDELKESESKSLKELKKLALFYSHNLHAKCYFNEKEMVITSMNMYQFSEKTNREMGILIDAEYDVEIYRDAVKEVDSIIKNANEVLLEKASLIEGKGYCIRCKTELSHNLYTPYCTKCFDSWRLSVDNNDKPEKYCHTCGDTYKTSLNSPQCFPCRINNPFKRDTM